MVCKRHLRVLAFAGWEYICDCPERIRLAAERTRRALTENASTTMSVVWKDEAFDLWTSEWGSLYEENS